MKMKLQEFIEELNQALKHDTLHKITLSAFASSEELQNIYIRPIELSEGPMCHFVYRYATKDITKNYTYKTSLELIKDFLKTKCRNADAQLKESVYSYKRLKSGKERLSKTVSEIKTHNKSHNLTKNTFISEQLEFLKHLGLADSSGRIKDKARRKFKQINRFIEILDQQIKKVEFESAIKIIDMGCGKGYLTFAMSHYLEKHHKIDFEIIGIENRDELVKNSNAISTKLNQSHLSFRQGDIIDADIDGAEILVALHACDTATDDAIAKGIRNKCKLIITAPCCHKQVRNDIENPSNGSEFYKYGIMKERFAEMATDLIRAQIMEDFGYKTQIIEFTNAENTAKNLMLVGRKSELKQDDMREEMKSLMSRYNIKRHYLEELMYSK